MKRVRKNKNTVKIKPLFLFRSLGIIEKYKEKTRQVPRSDTSFQRSDGTQFNFMRKNFSVSHTWCIHIANSVIRKERMHTV